MTRVRHDDRTPGGGVVSGQPVVVAAAVAWGTVGVAGRLADDAGIGPVSATAGRTVIAAAALLPLVAVTGVPALPTRSSARWGAGAVGLLGGVLVLVAVAVAGRRPRAVGRFVR